VGTRERVTVTGVPGHIDDRSNKDLDAREGDPQFTEQLLEVAIEALVLGLVTT